MSFLTKILQRRRILRALSSQLCEEVGMHWWGNASSTCRRIDRVKGKPVPASVSYIERGRQDWFIGQSFRMYYGNYRMGLHRWLYNGC